jgi:Ca-activated chloride channel family protein
MTERLNLSVAADRSLVWVEGDSVRYIVATVEARQPKDGASRPAAPLNLALVIDVSGSMAGEKLMRAKAAALGVVDRLREMDRLSIVSFASETVVHVEAMRLAEDARSGIRAAIESLETRGNTHLSEGWLTSAECVAKAIEGAGVNRIVLLSDGQANAGIVDPEQLAFHASELAKRSVTTSCVGIGDDYDSIVLQAIAEHGGGRLHDAELASDIVAALMGELGEIGNLAAQDVSIALHVPATAKAVFVGSAPTQVATGALSVSLGGFVGNRPRDCVFRVTLPEGKINETLLFGVTARGTAPDGTALEARPREVAFTLVEGARNNRQPRDEKTSMAVATAWHADIVRTSARMNRAGERRQARRYLERELRHFERYCGGMPEALPLLKEIAALKQNSDRSWDERTRKEMEFAAYAVQSNRADYRAPRKSWLNRLNDES